ncbi:unnamed protein product [Amoebophrya sp. A120]|nr:unnamed protein product [Amoebophrya sp. A120]|eukprot:GSA120T00005776001.1
MVINNRSHHHVLPAAVAEDNAPNENDDIVHFLPASRKQLQHPHEHVPSRPGSVPIGPPREYRDPPGLPLRSESANAGLTMWRDLLVDQRPPSTPDPFLPPALQSSSTPKIFGARPVSTPLPDVTRSSSANIEPLWTSASSSRGNSPIKSPRTATTFLHKMQHHSGTSSSSSARAPIPSFHQQHQVYVVQQPQPRRPGAGNLHFQPQSGTSAGGSSTSHSADVEHELRIHEQARAASAQAGMLKARPPPRGAEHLHDDILLDPEHDLPADVVDRSGSIPIHTPSPIGIGYHNPLVWEGLYRQFLAAESAYAQAAHHQAASEHHLAAAARIVKEQDEWRSPWSGVPEDPWWPEQGRPPHLPPPSESWRDPPVSLTDPYHESLRLYHEEQQRAVKVAAGAPPPATASVNGYHAYPPPAIPAPGVPTAASYDPRHHGPPPPLPPAALLRTKMSTPPPPSFAPPAPEPHPPPYRSERQMIKEHLDAELPPPGINLVNGTSTTIPPAAVAPSSNSHYYDRGAPPPPGQHPHATAGGPPPVLDRHLHGSRVATPNGAPPPHTTTSSSSSMAVPHINYDSSHNSTPSGWDQMHQHRPLGASSSSAASTATGSRGPPPPSLHHAGAAPVAGGPPPPIPPAVVHHYNNPHAMHFESPHLQQSPPANSDQLNYESTTEKSVHYNTRSHNTTGSGGGGPRGGGGRDRTGGGHNKSGTKENNGNLSRNGSKHYNRDPPYNSMYNSGTSTGGGNRMQSGTNDGGGRDNKPRSAMERRRGAAHPAAFPQAKFQLMDMEYPTDYEIAQEHPELANHLQGKVFQVISSQQGSKHVQRLLCESEIATKVIVCELQPHLVQLMRDQYANYAVSMVFSALPDLKRQELLASGFQINELVEIAQDKRGTHSLQALLHRCKDDPVGTVQTFLTQLLSRFLAFALDPNGTHVVQKCLQTFSQEGLQDMFGTICDFFPDMMHHPHGLCVLKVAITRAEKPWAEKLRQKVVDHTLALIENPFGNYAVQHALKSWGWEYCGPVIEQLRYRFADASTQKFSSNVVECILGVAPTEVGDTTHTNTAEQEDQAAQHVELASEPWQQRKKQSKTKLMTRIEIIREIIAPTNLGELLNSMYGQYVVKRALAVSERQEIEEITDAFETYLKGGTSGPGATNRKQARHRWERILHDNAHHRAANDRGLQNNQHGHQTALGSYNNY